jgi:hypothetical protein
MILGFGALLCVLTVVLMQLLIVRALVDVTDTHNILLTCACLCRWAG